MPVDVRISFRFRSLSILCFRVPKGRGICLFFFGGGGGMGAILQPLRWTFLKYQHCCVFFARAIPYIFLR